jgi:hypothetical protein
MPWQRLSERHDPRPKRTARRPVLSICADMLFVSFSGYSVFTARYFKALVLAQTGTVI